MIEKIIKLNNYLIKVMDFISTIKTNGFSNISETDKFKIAIMYDKIVHLLDNDKLTSNILNCLNGTDSTIAVSALDNFFLKRDIKYILDYLKTRCPKIKGGYKKNKKTKKQTHSKYSNKRQTHSKYSTKKQTHSKHSNKKHKHSKCSNKKTKIIKRYHSLVGGDVIELDDCSFCLEKMHGDINDPRAPNTDSFVLHTTANGIEHRFHIECFNELLSSNYSKLFLGGCVFCNLCNENIDNPISGTGCRGRGPFITWWTREILPLSPELTPPTEPRPAQPPIHFEDNSFIIDVLFIIIIATIITTSLFLILNQETPVEQLMQELIELRQQLQQLRRELNIENDATITQVNDSLNDSIELYIRDLLQYGFEL